MITERIRNIKEIVTDLDQLLSYVPFQKIEYQPDGNKSPMQRFTGAFSAVMRQAKVCHIPGTRFAGCGGEKFYARPGHLIEAEIDKMRNYPQNCKEEIIQAINDDMFYILSYNAGHIIESHELFLSQGADGIIKMIEQRLAGVGTELTERQKEFLVSAKYEWEEVLFCANRHEEYYRKKAEAASDPAERTEFFEIAETIGRVPRNPASTFREALQSIWFVYFCAQMDDIANHSLGRLDQYLYRYYKHDLESGILNQEEAAELFYDFWLKYTMGYTVSEKMGRSSWKGVGSADEDAHNGLSWLVTKIIDDKHVDDGQTVNICGLDENEQDATNELSWLVLSATSELKTIEPKAVVKYSEKTDKKFMDACYENLATGHGLPAIGYDETGFRGMAMEPDNKYTRKDIIDHCHIGCVELAVPGSSYVDPMSAWINLAKIVVHTLDSSCDDSNPRTWDDFFAAYIGQMKHFIDLYVEGTNQSNPFYNQYFFRPLTSTLLEGCIESALMAEDGGTKHWSKSINCCGFATAVNSLMVIKQMVYDEKEVSLAELNNILHKNFDGEEVFRQKLLNKVPKYGNGQTEVDEIARALAESFCAYVYLCKTYNGYSYRPGLYSFYATIRRQGKATPATPDGRKAGEVLSLNIAPAHGTIRNGLTAVIQSVLSFDHALAVNACTIDVHFSANTPVSVLKNINEYIADHNGLLSQFTVANVEEMKKAQEHPERYQDLIVRVTGFSARFTALDKETQDEIIKRSYWD